jgi:hypothetical protein
MDREMPVSGRILELFTGKRPELTVTQICHLLPDDDVASLKSAVRRLRGEGGKERCIRAKRYIHQAGHGGTAMPVFVLGSEPDAPKEMEFIVPNDEAVKRAAEVRRKREALSLQRQLAAMDSYS